jgi:GNAT superfamily N-acetyltransferase
MTINATHQDVLAAARAVLAADCACDPADFLADSITLVRAEERAGRRRHRRPAKPLLVVTMGAGVVASCHPERLEWLRDLLAGQRRDAIFGASIIAQLAQAVAEDGHWLAGPDLAYVCSRADFRPAAAPLPGGVEIAVVERDGMAALYAHEGFHNALGYSLMHPCPDMLATVATRDGAVVGVAGASADCDTLWQIGVDVVPEARGAGLGRALVSRLTDAVFDAGRVPYYTTAVSNIASRSLALGLGYRPVWTAMYAAVRQRRSLE